MIELIPKSFIHTADWQIGSGGFPDALDRQFWAIHFLRIEAEKRKLPVVVVGDIFDKRRPNQKEKDTFLSAMAEFDNAGVPIMLSLGNHDYEERSRNSYHSLETLKILGERFKNVTVILPGEIKTFNGLEFLCWVPGLSVVHPADVFLYHGIVKGAKKGNHTFDEGFETTLNKITEHFTPSYIALGDIHEQQSVKFKKVGAYYPGSLIPHKFDEKDSGFLIVHIEKETVGIESVHFADLSWKLEKVPDLVYVSQNVVDFDPVKMPTVHNAHIKIKLRGTSAELWAIKRREITNSLKERGVLSVQWEFDYISPREDVVRLPKLVHTHSLEEDLKVYYEEFGTPELNLSKLFEISECGSIIQNSKFTGVDIHNVHAINFGSLGDVKLNLDNQGLVLVVGKNLDEGGSNGSGKSLMFDPILYSLFEETIRGDRKDEIINKFTEGGMNLITEFTTKEKDWRVESFRNLPGAGSNMVLFPGKINSNYGEWDEGNAIRGVEDVKKKIVELIGVNSEVFKGVAFLGQEVAHGFVHGTDKTRKDFLNVFGLQIYDLVYNTVKKEFDTRESSVKTLAQVLDLRKQDLQGVQLLSPEELKTYQIKIEINTHKLEECKLAAQEHEIVMEGTAKQIQQEKVKEGKAISKLSAVQKVESTKRTLGILKGELSTLEIHLGDKRFQAKYYQDKLQGISKKLGEITFEVKGLNTLKSKFSSLGAVCPTCEQPVTEELCKKKITESINRMDVLSQEQQELQKKNQKAMELIGTIRQWEDCNQRVLTCESTLANMVQDDIMQCEKELDLIQRAIDKLCSSQEGMNKMRFELQNKIREYESAIQNANFEIEHQNRKQSEYQKMQTEIHENEEKLKEMSLDLAHYKFLKDAFGQHGIKSYKIDSLIDSLNKKILKYMGILSDGKIVAYFTGQTQKKDKGVKDALELFVVKNGVETKIRSCSGGEKKRVVVSTVFALWELLEAYYGDSTNILILDEVFDSLDELGMEKVVELLASIKREQKSVFVISHSPWVDTSGVFDQVWTVVKENGISHVEIESKS